MVSIATGVKGASQEDKVASLLNALVANHKSGTDKKLTLNPIQGAKDKNGGQQRHRREASQASKKWRAAATMQAARNMRKTPSLSTLISRAGPAHFDPRR